MAGNDPNPGKSPAAISCRHVSWNCKSLQHGFLLTVHLTHLPQARVPVPLSHTGQRKEPNSMFSPMFLGISESYRLFFHRNSWNLQWFPATRSSQEFQYVPMPFWHISSGNNDGNLLSVMEIMQHRNGKSHHLWMMDHFLWKQLGVFLSSVAAKHTAMFLLKSHWLPRCGAYFQRDTWRGFLLFLFSSQSVGCLFSAGSAKVARPRPGRRDEEGGAVRAGLSSRIGKLT